MSYVEDGCIGECGEGLEIDRMGISTMHTKRDIDEEYLFNIWRRVNQKLDLQQMTDLIDSLLDQIGEH